MAFTCLHRIALKYPASFNCFHEKEKERKNTPKQILGKIDDCGVFNSYNNNVEFYTDIYVPKFREDNPSKN